MNDSMTDWPRTLRHEMHWQRLAPALWAVLIVGLLLAGWAVSAGCTQGELTPLTIKHCVYAAEADARVTAARAKVAATTQPADTIRAEVIEALDRIGGRPPGYKDGLLSPVDAWLKGQKP